MATDIASYIRQHFEEIWHKGNLRFADEGSTEDFVAHDPVGGDLDREGLKQLASAYRQAFPDLRFRLDDILVAGDVGVCRWTATGTHRGDFLGIAPTGKRAPVTGVTIMRFVGDKAREAWVEWNALGLLRTLGAIPNLGAGAGVQPPTTAASRPSPEARH